MSMSQDGSESVDQFLARIASVKETRDHASEDRTRRMEEDFLKSRKERQARRLERARSLSPSKTGPSASNPISHSPAAARDTALNPPVDFSPRASTLSRSNAVSARTSPKLEPKRSEADPFSIPQNLASSSDGAAGLSRSGTLSWQQRPPRDGGNSRPRPLSTIETIRSVPKVEEEQTTSQPESTRQEIAASLGMKDPSWFRQTQERGLKSAAFRKTQVEDAATVEHTIRSQVLPGMSRNGSRSASSTPIRELEPVLPTQVRGPSPSPNNKFVREASPMLVSLSDAQKLEPSTQQKVHAEPQIDVTLSTLSRSGSTFGGRPASPTKGLGGFVESAMMKRSDSVNKRWSVQANAGLKRGDSIAGMRPLGTVRSIHATTLLNSSSRDRSPSPMSTSRPESREGIVGDKSLLATPDRKIDASKVPEESPKPVNIDTAVRPKTPSDDHLARSPSKTLDSKRWSPTKSSWLESALLSKPDPPKPQSAKEDIPAWKANLQRNKVSRDLSPEKAKSADSDLSNFISKDLKDLKKAPVIGKKSELEPRDSPVETEESEIDRKDMKKEVVNTPLSPVEALEAKNTIEEPARSDATKLRKTTTDSIEQITSEPVVEDKTEKKPPPVLKPKPQTPPKTDFRSTLKSRAPVQFGGNVVQPEFKSVFGKLKPAHTSNYVAPDTLKNNILSGKSALSVTGGPQKTQRVDEFKESILQKKEAMKVNAVQKKEAPASEAQSQKPEPAVPEALARRKTLHKASPSITKLQGSFGTPQTTVQEQAKPPVAAKPKTFVSQHAIVPASPPRQSIPSVETEAKKSIPWSNLKSSEIVSVPEPISHPDMAANMQKSISENEHSQTRTVTGLSTNTSIAHATAELPTGSKLASRLNPNLATLLLRGSSPLPAPSKSPSPERHDSEFPKQSNVNVTAQEPATGGELTHMTKGRARGPKRRAPKTEPTKVSVSAEPHIVENVSQADLTTEPTVKPTPNESVSSPKGNLTGPEISVAQFKRSTTLVSPVRIAAESVNKRTLDSEEKKTKPAVTTKSPELRRIPSPLSSQQADGPEAKVPSTGQFRIAADCDTNVDPDVKPVTRELPKTPKPPSVASPLTPSKSRINTPKQNQLTLHPPAKPQSSKPLAGLAVSAKSTPAKATITTGESTPVPGRSAKPSTMEKPQQRSSSDVDLKPFMSVCFPNLPEKQQIAEFDAHHLLLCAKNPGEKIKTTSHTIQEVNGDGKKSAMPPQQEHILFEESMYLVIHSFEVNAGSKSSEVYLWCGDHVADAAIEDAQLFCRKDARDHNAKLEVIRQGKEPARFFQALGGILIVRRSKSSSMYMLCGRRHLGHIAFDEVDLTTANLCSGFSYLISAKFGKFYLWNGEGSGADEVGCARLIGMDLGLTGEIEEVTEGEEPSSFWDSFSSQHSHDNNSKWSKDWQTRAKHDCYPTTLYRVELDRPKSAAGGFWGLARAASPLKPSNKAVIEVISPFSERDVERSNVYVLDAYRVIYVILNKQATTKTTEIVTALHLAQELAMLSPSVQDRSILPACFVTFGELPPDVKVCFRKWSERKASKSNASANELSACVRLEDVLEALKL